jgi:hypothetical protein
VDGSFRYVNVADLIESFAEMGVPERVVSLWLDALIKCGLCHNYDPTSLQVTGNGRVEITSAGHQHLVWATKEWVYIDAMMEVTPIRDSDCFRQMESLLSKGRVVSCHDLQDP